MITAPKKKLIEVSLPLETINLESAREKSIRHGHPSTLHLWWARRPLAAARAVIFAQLVDDPSSRPDEFPTAEAQDAERARLHELIEKLVVWENSNDSDLLKSAREEIKKSNNGELPAVLDPFAGGGAIPLEAQRLGLETFASDINPVAVLINKALIEIPPKFAARPPVHPQAETRMTAWTRMDGLAQDVRKYGEWMRDEAFHRVGHLYPEATAPGGTKHTVIAWIWARTVRSPNPANPVDAPLVRTWWLGKKKGKEAYVVPSTVDGEIRYEVRRDANGPKGSADGTRTGRGAISVADGTPISAEYIKKQGAAGKMGTHLIAVVAEGKRGRLYLSPDEVQRQAAQVARPSEVPDEELPYDPRNVWTPPYGLTKFSDLFTNRQLTTLTTLSDLVNEVRDRVLKDALAAGFPEGIPLEEGGSGALAYADAIATYLAFAISRTTNKSSSLCSWDSSPKMEAVRGLFARQTIPMAWDYAESNPFAESSGSFLNDVDWVAKAVAKLPGEGRGQATQANASARNYGSLAISTDPPYYDNINYSDLSDFFYVWLRRSLRNIQSRTVETMLTPKADELVANPYRHDGKEGAERFFVDGFNQVFQRIRETANTNVPLTVYYAYKQQDSKRDESSSTGWYTLLDGLIQNGWEITATWPLRSELSNRMIASGTNALGSSIVLACRPRPAHTQATTRRAFISALKAELPEALRKLMLGAIAPVDLDQAAIGPGIGVFSRYSRVREADGSDMTVRQALVLIKEITDEVRGEGIADMDSDTRFAVKWYRQYGWDQESSATAIQLAGSSGTTIGSLERGGILEAKGGKARLLSPAILGGVWNPELDDRVSVWEATVRLSAVMAEEGADKVAALLSAVQAKVNLDAVKELGFLLFHEAEKRADTQDAILFNSLISAWVDLTEQARKHGTRPRSGQQAFDFEEGD